MASKPVVPARPSSVNMTPENVETALAVSAKANEVSKQATEASEKAGGNKVLAGAAVVGGKKKCHAHAHAFWGWYLIEYAAGNVS